MFQEYMYSTEDFSKTLIDLCSIMATFPNLNVLISYQSKRRLVNPKYQTWFPRVEFLSLILPKYYVESELELMLDRLEYLKGIELHFIGRNVAISPLRDENWTALCPSKSDA